MKTTLKRLIGATCISFSLVFSAQAALTNQDITIYNQAATGDETQVEPAYERFTQLIETEGATALTLTYLGSIQTLKGRDAWMPWTKMKHVEQGLANIDKGLSLLTSEITPLSQQASYQGLKENFLTRALGATTYSTLPDMFNHFERGYELFLTLLAEPEFKQQPFPASAWVYYYAVQAALRADDLPQATQWLTVMQQQGKTHPKTIAAQVMISGEKS